ncbi:PucR family transcriptional regulator [Streptomyces sp. NPDC050418]|uniref:PucR family transcriptional regulator n=1 Tax=Streptomyces sp. NPDC050418 TaxID=3365612 RepID=UPI0037ACEC2C
MAGSPALARRTAPAAALTVAQALELPALAGARLVAGHAGALHPIRVANIMEVPDIVRWMRGGEFLLTTAYAVRDDERALAALVPEMARRGLAALGVKVGPYLPVLPASMLRCADELAFPIVELPGEVMLNDILSEVIGTVLNRQALSLERTQALRERLSQAVLSGGSQRELIALLSRETGCPAAIRAVGADAAGGSAPAHGDAPPTPPTVTRPITVGGRTRVEVALWGAESRTSEAELALAVEHVASLATMLLVQERALAERERRYRTLLLTALVSHPPGDRAEAARRAAALGWDLERERATVVVEVSAAPGARTAPVTEERLLSAARTALGAQTPAWGTPGGMTVLAEPGSSLRRTCAALHRAVAAACPSHTVAVAAGTVRADFVELHLSHGEALSALALGRELEGIEGSFTRLYEECGVYRLLNQLPDTELRALVAETLGPLIEHDARHDSSLVHSLSVYLQRDRNGVDAAEELHVHYNTLRYRLKQIEKLTGAPDKDPMRRLQTELAVHAHRLLSARLR